MEKQTDRPDSHAKNVPIRFVAEALGAEVTWDGKKMRVGVKRE